MRFLDPYKNLGYIAFMDKFYSSPYLFYNLLIKNKTASCRTTRPQKGLPGDLSKAIFKERGENKITSYSDKLAGLRILDRKHVTLLSTIYSTNLVDTGKKHWQTKKAIMKPSMIHN